LGAGFSATLAARLDLVATLRVADPFETRAAAHRRSVVADDNAQVQALGQELSADYVLTGHILREETNLTITAWLVNVKTGRRQGEQKLTGRQDALFALQNQFLAGWLRPLRLKLS
jgi:TolB-like protein